MRAGCFVVGGYGLGSLVVTGSAGHPQRLQTWGTSLQIGWKTANLEDWTRKHKFQSSTTRNICVHGFLKHDTQAQVSIKPSAFATAAASGMAVDVRQKSSWGRLVLPRKHVRQVVFQVWVLAILRLWQ